MGKHHFRIGYYCHYHQSCQSVYFYFIQHNLDSEHHHRQSILQRRKIRVTANDGEAANNTANSRIIHFCFGHDRAVFRFNISQSHHHAGYHKPFRFRQFFYSDESWAKFRSIRCVLGIIFSFQIVDLWRPTRTLFTRISKTLMATSRLSFLPAVKQPLPTYDDSRHIKYKCQSRTS